MGTTIDTSFCSFYTSWTCSSTRVADSALFLRSPIFACSRSLSRAAPLPQCPDPSLASRPSDQHPYPATAVRSLPLPPLEISPTFSKPPPHFFLFSFLSSFPSDRTKTELPSIPKRSKRGSEGSPHPRLRLHLARSDPSAGGPAQAIGANAAGTEPALLLIAVSRTRSDSLDRCVSPQLLRLFSGRFDGERVNLSSAWSGARDFAWSVSISRPISDSVRGDVSRAAGRRWLCVSSLWFSIGV
jgi:hypothetical protein